MRVPPPAVQFSPAVAAKTPVPRVPPPADQDSEQLQPSRSIEEYILAYYYAALTNLFCQVHLSSVENLEGDDAVKAVADRSYSDFCTLDASLVALDQGELERNANFPLYLEARDGWKNLVKNCSMLAKSDEKPAQSPLDHQPAGIP